jgi:alpha-galactosidase
VVFEWAKKAVVDDLSKRNTRFDTIVYRVRDLWKKKDLGTTSEKLDADVPGNDVLMLRLNKAQD